MTRTGMLLACCMALTACASPPVSGGLLPQRAAAPKLFVSPFGEPFSSEPGTPYPSAAWFDGADADASGEIDLAEFLADGRRYFAVLDGDGDQVLGIGEIAAYEAVMASLRGRIGGPPTARPGGSRPSGRPGDAPMALQDPGGRGGPPSGGSPMGAGRPRGPGGPRSPAGYGPIADADIFGRPQAILTADANFDRRITSQEWVAAGERWFVVLDRNRDGRILLAELPETKAQRVQVRRGR